MIECCSGGAQDCILQQSAGAARHRTPRLVLPPPDRQAAYGSRQRSPPILWIVGTDTPVSSAIGPGGNPAGQATRHRGVGPLQT